MPGLPPSVGRPASLFLVLASAAYDALLTVAVLFVATGLAVLANHGEAIPAGTFAFDAYLLAAGCPYFAWCWTRGGQTLGMRAWRLRIERTGGGLPGWGSALARYFAALASCAALGLGFVWILIDRKHMSWHDHLSGTRIVRAE